jgi:hypothetical protein
MIGPGGGVDSGNDFNNNFNVLFEFLVLCKINSWRCVCNH